MNSSGAQNITARTAPDSDESTVRRRRIAGLVVAIVAGGVLLVAAILEPSPTGLGTHSSVGMPPCGWITMFDTPCPTCGMTTAFAHAANGNIHLALHAQPLGGLLALGTAIAFLCGVHVAITGSRIGVVMARLWGRKTAWLLGALLLLSWVYKIIVYKELL